MGIPNGTNEGVGEGASYAKLIRIGVRLLGEKRQGNIDGIVLVTDTAFYGWVLNLSEEELAQGMKLLMFSRKWIIVFDFLKLD